MAQEYDAPEQSAPDGDNITLNERLRDYYSPSDFVIVQNVDIEPLKYQFMNPANEEFIQPAPYAGETYHKKPPTIVVLEPGETRLCPAFEADLMIVTLVKKLTSRKTHEAIDKGEAARWQATNWNDPQTQRELIAKIFLGKQDLVGQFNQAEKQVEKDLGIEPAEPARVGRPRKATQGA